MDNTLNEREVFISPKFVLLMNCIWLLHFQSSIFSFPREIDTYKTQVVKKTTPGVLKTAHTYAITNS